MIVMQNDDKVCAFSGPPDELMLVYVIYQTWLWPDWLNNTNQISHQLAIVTLACKNGRLLLNNTVTNFDKILDHIKSVCHDTRITIV